MNGESFSTCNILGVDIADINMDRLVRYTEQHLAELSGKYYCFANVYSTVTAYENARLKEAYHAAELVMPDGGPLSTVARKRGHPKTERTTGPSFMEEILRRGYRHFFYGSTQDTLEAMRQQIRKQYPSAIVAGAISPPFRRLTEDEVESVTNQINETGADFIWVGLGAPKQELWMNLNKGKFHGLMCGVGAAFDYLAGNINRAPEWMQNHNMEWLYRLKQEPARLFKRYTSTNMKFIWNAMIMGR